ncbi:unnamed protein product [Caenorhabditis nigoni]
MENEEYELKVDDKCCGTIQPDAFFKRFYQFIEYSSKTSRRTGNAGSSGIVDFRWPDAKECINSFTVFIGIGMFHGESSLPSTSRHCNFNLLIFVSFNKIMSQDLLVSQMVSTIPAEFRTQYMNQRVKGWEVFICTISNMLKRKGVNITKQKDRSAHQGVPPFMLKIQAILIACNHHLKECNDWFDSSPLIMNDKVVIYRKSRSCVAQSTAERIINVYNEELSALHKLMSESDRIPILQDEKLIHYNYGIEGEHGNDCSYSTNKWKTKRRGDMEKYRETHSMMSFSIKKQYKVQFEPTKKLDNSSNSPCSTQV